MNSVKSTLPLLRNIKWRTLKTETNRINQMLPYISTNNISELNDLINAVAKLVCEKIGVPSKSTEKQSKPGWEVRLETQIKKKSTKTGQILKQKDPGICGKRMKKTTREKNNSTTWGNKPEGSGERRETKEISTKGKTIQTKQDIPKQRKKILYTINIPTTRR